ncbi:MAG: DUF5723 family protein [Bacteroidota bacterium]
MKKSALIIFLFFFPLLMFAQRLQENFPVAGSETKHFVRTWGEGYYDSQDITNTFSSKFFGGGFIDSTLKNDIYNQLKDENRIGAEISYGIQSFHFTTSFFGRPHWGWAFGASHHEYYNALFSKNLFGLTFFGNSMFAGDTISLDPFEANQLRFNKFQFGIFNKENFSRVMLSVLSAESFFEMKINSAQLYTEASGNELALSLSENMSRSDTGSTGWGSYNGMGAAIDFVIHLNSGKNRSALFSNGFSISVENLGFLRWNENTLHQQSDSSYYYEGFEVENILDENNSVYTGQSVNDTVSISYTRTAKTTPLPFTFSFSKTIDRFSESKIQSFYGLRMRAFCNYKPMIFAGVAFIPSQKFTVSPYVSFGGYGSFKAGLQAEASLTKYFRLAVSSTNLVGNISKNGYGKDLAVTLYSMF